MSYKKRRSLVILAVAAALLSLCAVLFTACKGGKNDDGGVEEGTTSYGLLTVEDSGSLNSSYSVPVGDSVLTYIQKEGDPEKAHAEFDHWEYEGAALTSDLVMTSEGATITAVYKIEITIEIYAADLDTTTWQGLGTYSAMPELNVYYYALEGTTFKASIEELDGLTGGSFEGSSSITVSSDYTKNVIRENFSRMAITIRYYPNYPADSGLTGVTYTTVQTYYGYPVVLPTDYSCDGYLMLGWTVNRANATYPDYAVNGAISNLMVWNADKGVYEPAEESYEETLYYPSGETDTEGLFATWGKGYRNIAGGDTVYILEEDAECAYLERGGYVFASTQKLDDIYYFANPYTGSGSYYRIRLGENYTFVYWDSTRVGTYYLYEYSYDGTTFSGNYKSSEYIVFGELNEFMYYSADGTSRGEYTWDDYYYYLTFESGARAGETEIIYLTETGGGTSVFLVENEEEATMGIQTIGAVLYDEEYGLGLGYYYTSYYYLYLDGFHGCVYYDYYYGSSTYYYWLESDVLYLFSFSSYYGYTLEYMFKKVLTDYGVYWFVYDSSLDATFNVYGENDELLGTVTCDGYLYAVYTATDGRSWTGYFCEEYMVAGYTMRLESFEGDGTCNLYLEDIEGGSYKVDADGHYRLVAFLDTYRECYLYTPYGLTYDTLILDYNGAGTCEYVILGYDIYGYGYYFVAFTGTYKYYESSEYPMGYYVFEVDTWNDLSSIYYYYGIYYDYSYFGYETYYDMSNLGFILGTYGSYDVDVLLWYDLRDPSDETEPESVSAYGVATYAAAYYEESGEEDSDPLKNTHDVAFYDTYTVENFGFWFDYISYEIDENGDVIKTTYKEKLETEISGTLNVLITEAGLVYGSVEVTLENESTFELDIYTGEVYGTVAVGDDGTATCLYLELVGILGEYSAAGTNGTGNATDDGNDGDGATGEATSYWIYGYTFVFLTFEESVATVVDDIPVYYYEYSVEEGLSDSAYITYNGLAVTDVGYTYHNGTSDYTGTVAKKETDSFGHDVYTFTPDDTCSGNIQAFDFVYMSYGGERVIVMYGETVTYAGSDGSRIEIDPVGYYINYTDAHGTTYQTTVSYFERVVPEEEESLGHFGAGYMQMYFPDYGKVVVVDLLSATDEEGNDGTYAYTVRGAEYGEYYIINNILADYYVMLDGYGAVTVYALQADEEGNLVQVGEGTYSITDTVISMECSIYGAEHYKDGSSSDGVSSETYTITEAELDVYYAVAVKDGDRVLYMYYGGIYVNESTYTGRYINIVDMSVLVLENKSEATKYLADGTVEEGEYTWLDETYFYYVNGEGTSAAIYKKVDGFNVEEQDYSRYVAKYYTNDLGEYIEFTYYGRVTLDSGSSYAYYTVDENGKVTIYYRADTEDKNNYGYSTLNFGTVGSKEYTDTSTNTTYYNLMYEGATTYTLTRASGEESKYNFRNVNTHYTLDDLVLDVTTMTGETATATLYVGYGTSEPSVTAYIYMVRETDEDGKDTVTIYMDAYTSVSSYSYYYTYYDYLVYEYVIKVDLSQGTYSVTDEKLYLDTYSYECLFYYYYYLYYYYYGDTSTAYYYYLMAYEYYSYIDLVFDIDESGACTEILAYGYIEPYVYYDEETDDTGATSYVYTFMLDGVKVEAASDYSYFTATFEGGDGYEYEMSFFLDFDNYLSGAYFGYHALLVSYLWAPNSFTTYTDACMKYYTATLGYVMYSSPALSGAYGIGTLLLDFHYYVQVDSTWMEISLDGVTIFTENGNVYFVNELTDPTTGAVSTQYYELSFEGYDDETKKHSTMAVTVTSKVTSYYMEDGGFIDVYTYTDEETQETTTDILLVYIDGTYYYVQSFEEGEDSSYTVTISLGTYTVTLSSEGGTNTATMTEVSEEPEEP